MNSPDLPPETRLQLEICHFGRDILLEHGSPRDTNPPSTVAVIPHLNGTNYDLQVDFTPEEETFSLWLRPHDLPLSDLSGYRLDVIPGGEAQQQIEMLMTRPDIVAALPIDPRIIAGLVDDNGALIQLKDNWAETTIPVEKAHAIIFGQPTLR